MSLIKRLVCDYPECDSIKEDLIWWETSEAHPEKWRRTRKDLIGWQTSEEHPEKGLHWCWIHSEDEIQGAIYIMIQEGWGNDSIVEDIPKEKP